MKSNLNVRFCVFSNFWSRLLQHLRSIIRFQTGKTPQWPTSLGTQESLWCEKGVVVGKLIHDECGGKKP